MLFLKVENKKGYATVEKDKSKYNILGVAHQYKDLYFFRDAISGVLENERAKGKNIFNSHTYRKFRTSQRRISSLISYAEETSKLYLNGVRELVNDSEIIALEGTSTLYPPPQPYYFQEYYSDGKDAFSRGFQIAKNMRRGVYNIDVHSPMLIDTRAEFNQMLWKSILDKNAEQSFPKEIIHYRDAIFAYNINILGQEHSSVGFICGRLHVENTKSLLETGKNLLNEPLEELLQKAKEYYKVPEFKPIKIA